MNGRFGCVWNYISRGLSSGGEDRLRQTGYYLAGKRRSSLPVGPTLVLFHPMIAITLVVTERTLATSGVRAIGQQPGEMNRGRP
jgi:hypothetical protein